ncbi:Imm1 family immunity protein [Amycolatopsis rhabdoformis]|uniref:Imm1 family immunity protein n=1 Tax=Amycolatopsis rhabdoformis TaxID=1448059 RepID=A0ABZ1IDM2_9PSEU|nr:Imm1 family immunity protein [Amycolatopsis rhabdoformis]WSE31525.1 Imm1 family immunity protein [Amycolatopsis rhabdoformis]
MTTTGDRRTGYDVTSVPPETVLAALRAAVPPSPTAGVVWWIYAGQGPGLPHLVAGLRGDRGALVWRENGSLHLPTDGAGSAPADYFSLQGGHFPQPAGSDVPAELVLRAVQEFAETRVRPECVAWKVS